MATRKRRNWRRRVAKGREPLGGKCEAAECPEDAVTVIRVPDDGHKPHRVCQRHATAMEWQMRRNEAAAREKRRQETAERLGIR